MYTTTRHEARITVPEYLEGYVDIPTFRSACEACGNYGRVWACPPYDFEVEEYWRQYQSLHLLAIKIVFEEKYTQQTYTQEELWALVTPVLKTEKQKLSKELMEAEGLHPGSISLSAGSCERCARGCQRAVGKPCLYPEEMRHSIESLGGNVGLTISKLMGLRLEWIEEGRLPHHFVLVGGLLVKE